MSRDYCINCHMHELRGDAMLEARSDVTRCSSCGGELIEKPKILCTKCSGELRLTDKFCISCGQKVTEYIAIPINIGKEK